MKDAVVSHGQNRAIQDALARFSIEMLPKDTQRIDNIADHLPRGTQVYVAYTSGSTAEIVQAVEKLHRQGMAPVPHIPARRFASHGELRGFLADLTARAEISQILLVAGDLAQPAGPFSSSADVLRTGLIEGHGIKAVHFAGHPEGHPTVSDAALREALIEKCELARQIGLKPSLTTQFLFDMDRLFAWHSDFVETSVPGLPVDIGLPGLAKMTTLMRFAKDCGVGTSFGMLTRNFGRAFKLATSFSPEQALADLARGMAGGGRPQFRSVHFYPFGSFERTAEWLRRAQTGTGMAAQAAG